MKATYVALLLIGVVRCVPASDHLVNPGESPQAIFDRAAPGDRLVFLPGVHEHGLGKHRAILYIDKSMHIELRAGATLRLRDGTTELEAEPEITTDQDAGKRLDDLTVGGQFDVSRPAIYTLRIDGVGTAEQPDTFAWGVYYNVANPQGSIKLSSRESKFAETSLSGVPITGDWQELNHGVNIRFGSQTGHSPGSLWFISYDGPEAYGIRIGHGLQSEVIEGVSITGKGTIDMNASRNMQPSFLVKNINACVLIQGRVRNVLVEGITMQDTNRSVMIYGEHTGEFLPGGAVTAGESFDVENVTIQYTRTLNHEGSGYLLGHPSHRGRLSNIQCNFNYMETAVTAIEPNFNLNGYEVTGNVIKSGGKAIHCWRHSKSGVIADNLRIHDNTDQQVVVLGAPAGWQQPEPPTLRNNRNHLSQPKPDPTR